LTVDVEAEATAQNNQSNNFSVAINEDENVYQPEEQKRANSEDIGDEDDDQTKNQPGSGFKATSRPEDINNVDANQADQVIGEQQLFVKNEDNQSIGGEA
jgi:hypothetical protein